MLQLVSDRVPKIWVLGICSPYGSPIEKRVQIKGKINKSDHNFLAEGDVTKSSNTYAKHLPIFCSPKAIFGYPICH